MLAAYTSLQNAQKVKEFLLKKKVLHPDYLPLKEMGMIYFPITKKIAVFGVKIVDTNFSFQKRIKSQSVEELLKSKLAKKELESIPKAQEIIGSILILEIPEELRKKEKIIAQAFLKLHKNVKTVVRKEKAHSGIFRTRKLKFLAGKNTKETMHTESGLRIKINVEKMYFSSRLSNERLRIAKQIKKNENVLVMFSGAGPYLLVLAKHSLAGHVYGIEINPSAYQYASDNVLLNKLNSRISLSLGDVRKIVPSLKKKFDRIVMPLPKTGEEFLPLALSAVKKGGAIHFYRFLRDSEMESEADKIKSICREQKHQAKIIQAVKCGQFSPDTFRVCFDLKVIK